MQREQSVTDMCCQHKVIFCVKQHQDMCWLHAGTSNPQRHVLSTQGDILRDITPTSCSGKQSAMDMCCRRFSASFVMDVCCQHEETVRVTHAQVSCSDKQSVTDCVVNTRCVLRGQHVAKQSKTDMSCQRKLVFCGFSASDFGCGAFSGRPP